MCTADVACNKEEEGGEDVNREHNCLPSPEHPKKLKSPKGPKKDKNMAALLDNSITVKLPGERELVSTEERVKQLIEEVKASCPDLTKIHELVL